VHRVTVVVPAVRTFEPRAGELRLQSLATVSVRHREALPVAESFRDRMRELADLEVPGATVAVAATGTDLRIELEAGCIGPITRGIRADGAGPDREAYHLAVSETGVLVRAGTPEGADRALTSLLQLAALGDGVVPCGTIDDAPEFAWRGLSLDVVRTFVPLAEVKRVVDMLSLYKLNVLHLHLTDNEAWRLQINSWPRLTDDRHYTQPEFRELVAYARERFVTVIPEIDLPGHSTAALAAYPELGGAGADSPNLDPASEHVWRFVHDVMSEVAAISPAPYIHIGGDEAFGMGDGEHAEFVDRTVSIVKGLGKRVVGWQEICRSAVGPDDVVQHWIDFAHGIEENNAAAALAVDDLPREVLHMLIDHFSKAHDDVGRMVQKQVRVLLSPTGHLYLDRPHADASTRPEQDALRSRLGLQFYPPSSLEAMFDWDPLHAVAGLDAGSFAGVEAAVWCETVESMNDLELLLLPRLLGVAEAAWCASRRSAWGDHRARLAVHATLWRRAGWSWYHADSVEWAIE
jgi:hexosaminidase